MMSSLRLLGLSLFLLFLQAAPARAFDPCTDAKHYIPLEKRYTKGLLFKIEKCHKPVSYVFGTIHLDRPEVDAVAGPAFGVLQNVDAVGFELAEASDEVVQKIIKNANFKLAPGKRLSAMIGAASFERLVADLRLMALAQGNFIRQDRLEQMPPWMAAVMLETMDEKQGTVLDEKLWIAASLAGKPIFGLETVDEQMQVFTGLSDSLQIRMLKEMVDHFQELRAAKSQLIAAYLALDAKRVNALDDQYAAKTDDAELKHELDERLIVDRNRLMEQRLKPRLEHQSVLTCVGLMHLMGRDGLLHLLERDGYYVTPIP